MKSMTLLGDEAVAFAAIDSGITAVYGYPGTPSTEILECIHGQMIKNGKPKAFWCTNEKTSFEAALGASLAGKRSLVTMKHVGLNVAADPFLNAAVVKIHGGLVLAVADDPGMHSSQNEQDSRFYADFGKTICLEPSDQQETYDMTREAFDVSERFNMPVMLRLVTRLAHSRAQVARSNEHAENMLNKAKDTQSWILMPGNARRRWGERLTQEKELQSYSENSPFNTLFINEKSDLAVITNGIAKNYYLENIDGLQEKPSHLHIGTYPLPLEKIRELAKSARTILVLEEGYPFIERQLRGILPMAKKISGKMSGEVPAQGELTPEIARAALGLKPKEAAKPASITLPGRPPQLCAGCPHADSFSSLKKALTAFKDSTVTSDIGCYTLGALPPYSAIESTVCMGASIGMAKGAADAGLYPVVAVIGDSTFYHSGISPLIDAVKANTNMTLLIVDNEATAMTGGQETILPSDRLITLLKGIGVDENHLHILTTHRTKIDENAEVMKKEFEYKGLSVIVAKRECIETAKRKKK